jgi:hypothetical protein
MKPTDPGGHAQPPAHRRYDDGIVHHPHVDGDGHDDLHNDDVAHEHQDVDLRAIVTSAVVLAVVAIVSLGAMIALFNVFESEATGRQVAVSPLTAQPTDMPKTTSSPFFSQGVSAPPLLTNEPMVLDKLQAEQRTRLQTGGWVDEKAGVAHLPIAEAKKLLLQKGVPVREGSAAASFTVRPWARGESSGGRTVTVDLPDSPAAPGTAPAPEHGQPHGGAPAGEKPPAKQGGH